MYSFLDIKNFLPHRSPFLMIDRIIEWKQGEMIKTQKNITASEPVLQGHFPELPIFPGAYLLEAMAQSGGLLYYKNDDILCKNQSVILNGVKNLVFKRLVIPGNVIMIETRMIRKLDKFFMVDASASTNGELVSKAALTFAVLLKEELADIYHDVGKGELP
jgi:3-hydroxyacyl-[acyl-carrier-protein] dehydratase